MRPARSTTVVIGIGNVIHSDDGLGVHAVRRLRHRTLGADDIQLIEGGTAGLMLLPHLAAARRAIIIDAIAFGAPAGTLLRLEPSLSVFATGITPHEIGLADLLDAMRLTGACPDQLLLHGAQPGDTTLGTELTPPVAAALDELVDAIETDLAAWHAPNRGRQWTRRSSTTPAPTGDPRSVRRHS
jgi:hydrogenase maturation protease